MTQKIDVARLELSITMIKDYVKDESVLPLLGLLEKLKVNQNDTTIIPELITTLNNLGVLQGAVLTYAPYITALISDDPFDNKEIW